MEGERERERERERENVKTWHQQLIIDDWIKKISLSSITLKICSQIFGRVDQSGMSRPRFGLPQRKSRSETSLQLWKSRLEEE